MKEFSYTMVTTADMRAFMVSDLMDMLRKNAGIIMGKELTTYFEPTSRDVGAGLGYPTHRPDKEYKWSLVVGTPQQYKDAINTAKAEGFSRAMTRARPR